ncbi:MAG: formate/nitrite transporter family protein [Clostridia bacterium]|nr:formate/nitrite transporter family protein [Clostridia bacterium]
MLSPVQIAEKYVSVGKNKANTPIAKMFVLSLFAGMFIAIAGASATIASCMADNASVSRLINSMIFPAGLVMVVLAGSELFTGNCLILVSVLKKEVSFLAYLKCLAIVYIGNLLGSIFIAAMFVYGHTPSLYGGKLAEVLASTAAAKTSLSFSDGFIRGVLCNFLVCIAVWITIGASNGADKVLGLYPPIFVFVLAGYEHCVANMFYIPAGIFASYEYNIAADGLNWLTFFTRNLIPVTLGNIIGGALIVGGGYFFAFLSGSKKAEEKKDGKKK